MIIYGVRRYTDKLDEVEASGETPQCFLVGNGRRKSKASEYEHWFKSESEALEYLIADRTRRMESAQRQVNAFNAEIAQARRRLNGLGTRF